VGALGKGQETRIKSELNQLDAAMMEYKNKVTAFPPNCQTDDMDTAAIEPAATPLSESHVLSDLRKHLSQIAPRNAEPDDLLMRIAGLATTGERLEGGMTAGEALVFWLSGFSTNPEFPISGDGGPSYNITGISDADEKRKKDPIEDRNWVFPFEVSRLVPRSPVDNYFDITDGRFIEYQVTINGVTQTRRINFWQYTPAKSQRPYLYFDTSRHPAYDTTAGVQPSRFDPPAATNLATNLTLHVHPFKKASESTSTNAPAIQFINPDKFQIIHSGRDEAWDEPAFERMSVHDVGTNNPGDYLLFPNGPFIGEIADTIVNFAEQTRIEDAQP
jgi:hypothetical protein